MKCSFLVISCLIFFIETAWSIVDSCKCPVTGVGTSKQFINTGVTLKILLVEFSDVKHRTSPSAYTKTNFENLLVSSGIYVSPNMYGPDNNELVYGSLADYYQQMSSGNLLISGYVVNNVQNNVPIWVTLSNTKSNYNSGSFWTFVNDAINTATTQGLNVGGLSNSSVMMVIIYAGNLYWGGGLNPAANGIPGTIYIMSERNGDPKNQENSTDVFGRIGAHCHEFAHLLGITHTTGSRADVMDAGRKNGPNSGGSNGAAPAPLNPIARMMKGWVTPKPISGEQPENAYYYLQSPEVFQINSNANGDYFLFENRGFTQNMVIGSTSVPDYNNTAFMPISWAQDPSSSNIAEGMLVWRVLGGGPTGYDDNGLVYASGRFNLTYPGNFATETDAGDPFPGDAGIKVFSPWSDSRSPYGLNGPPPYYNTLYVPVSTASTNVGMEVLSENPSAGYFSIELYQSNPQDASPSKPENVQASFNGSGQVNVSWSANQEPDMISGGVIVGSYNVYRAVYYSGGSLTYTMLNSSALQTTTFTDNTPPPTGLPTGVDVYYRYHVIATDTQNKTSVPSDDYWYYVGNTVSGTIISNVTWNANRLVVGNVNVVASGNLGINPGVNVTFAGGAALIVGSQFYANGNSTSPITFNFESPNSSTGNGIQFNSGSNGSISYCQVRNGYYGVYENGVNVGISNSAISGCTNGIYLSNSSPTLQSNNVHNNSNAGIYATSSSPTLYNNYIQNNQFGLYAITNSNPKMGSGSTQGKNNITSNSTGVYCWNNSYPMLGQNSPLSGGYDNLTNTTWNVVNMTGYAIYGCNNWWGTTNSNNFLISGTGSVGYNPYLSSSVNVPAPPLSKTDGSIFASQGSTLPMQSTLDSAYLLMAAGNLSGARALCLNLITNFPDYSVSFNALNLLKETFAASDFTVERALYQSIFSGKTKRTIYAIAGLDLANIDRSNRLVLIDSVISNYQESPVIELALFDKFACYYFDMLDRGNARTISNQLDNMFPGSIGSFEAHRILGDMRYYDSASVSSGQSQQTISPQPVTDYTLSQNYPNPFNPTTTISYRVTQPGLVTLKVFDVLGREVATLVNMEQGSGTYTARFDASHLSSGMYFYQLVAPGVNQTRKMLVTK